MNRLLKMAVVGGSERAVMLHIERGDDLDAFDDNGFTPLMLAAAKNRAAICQILFRAGANVFATDTRGRDALFIAKATGASEAASIIESEMVAKQASAELDVAPPDAGQAEPDVPGELSNVVGWEAEIEPAAPANDVGLMAQSMAIHSVLTLHDPFDDSADWSDFEAIFPEFAAPLPREEDADTAAKIRSLLLRAIREGSVPSMLVDAALTRIESCDSDTPLSLMRIVLEDLGAEVDERFEYWAPEESFEVFVDPLESDEEEDGVDGAIAFLENLEAHRNDPMRHYMREAGRHPLLSAREETDLAKALDDATRDAAKALAAWPEGLSRMFDAIDAARSGTLRISEITKGLGAENDTEALPDEAAPSISAARDGSLDASTDETLLAANVHDENEEASVEGHSVEDFLRRAEALRAVVHLDALDTQPDPRAEVLVQSLSLSPTFFLTLAEHAKEGRLARKFVIATRTLALLREQMVAANLRLVISIARRYIGSGLPMDDLIQEGNMGLIKAVDRFDWRRGFKLSTMATWWIRQKVSRHVADAAFEIRLPVHCREPVLLIARELRTLGLDPGGREVAKLIAARLDMESASVERFMRAMSVPLSMDELDFKLADEGEVEPDPFFELDRKQRRAAVIESLGVLEERQAEVLKLRFGIGADDSLTLEQVGQHYKLTRERIRQIESKAIKRLMKPAMRDRFNVWLAPKQAKGQELTESGNAEVKPNGIAEENAVGEGRANADLAAADEGLTQIAQLLDLARSLGLSVDDARDGASQATWVNVAEAEDGATRDLIRGLLSAGFQHWPGKGYWL